MSAESIAFATDAQVANALVAPATVRNMSEQEMQAHRMQRLAAMVEREGGKAPAGRRLGYKDGAFVGQMLRGERPITEKTVAAVHALLGYAGWFDSQSGQERQQSNVSPAPIGARSVPVISAIQAGMWCEIVDQFQPGDADEYLMTDLELSAHAFALTIRGDSMLPEFNPGDRVIIDPDVAPHPGDFVAAKNGEQEATFKKYRPRGMDASGNMVFELVPLNDDYPTLRSDIEPIRIVGTMVEHRKYRRAR